MKVEESESNERIAAAQKRCGGCPVYGNALSILTTFPMEATSLLLGLSEENLISKA